MPSSGPTLSLKGYICHVLVMRLHYVCVWIATASCWEVNANTNPSITLMQMSERSHYTTTVLNRFTNATLTQTHKRSHPIMWVSALSGHGACCLISQWGSTIKVCLKFRFYSEGEGWEGNHPYLQPYKLYLRSDLLVPSFSLTSRTFFFKCIKKISHIHSSVVDGIW